jgi:hypothetical protein
MKLCLPATQKKDYLWGEDNILLKTKAEDLPVPFGDRNADTQFGGESTVRDKLDLAPSACVRLLLREANQRTGLVKIIAERMGIDPRAHDSSFSGFGQDVGEELVAAQTLFEFADKDIL